jgi:hypothetical protein
MEQVEELYNYGTYTIPLIALIGVAISFGLAVNESRLHNALTTVLLLINLFNIYNNWELRDRITLLIKKTQSLSDQLQSQLASTVN